MSKYWGYHLQLNARSCNEKAKYPNASAIITFTKELVKAIDMVPYGEPQIYHFGSDNKAGYTMIQLIETSNISGHFCDDSGDVYMDIFSCKKFDKKIVITLFQTCFEPEHITHQFTKRQA